jgi:hypothetical protein
VSEKEPFAKKSQIYGLVGVLLWVVFMAILVPEILSVRFFLGGFVGMMAIFFFIMAAFRAVQEHREDKKGKETLHE